MGNRRGSGFFGGFVIGSIVGAVAAFFISQKSDRDTMRGKLGDLVARGKGAISEAIDEGKTAASQKEAEFQAGLEDEEK